MKTTILGLALMIYALIGLSACQPAAKQATIAAVEQPEAPINEAVPSDTHEPYEAFLGSSYAVNAVIPPRYGNNLENLNDVEEVRLIQDQSDERNFNLQLRLSDGSVGEHNVYQGPLYGNYFQLDSVVKPSLASPIQWAVIRNFQWVNGYVAQLEMCLYTVQNSGIVANQTCRNFTGEIQ